MNRPVTLEVGRGGVDDKFRVESEIPSLNVLVERDTELGRRRKGWRVEQGIPAMPDREWRPRYRNSGAFVHGTKFVHFGPIMEQGAAFDCESVGIRTDGVCFRLCPRAILPGLKAAKSEIFMIDEVRADGRVGSPEHSSFCGGMVDESGGMWNGSSVTGVSRCLG